MAQRSGMLLLVKLLAFFQNSQSPDMLEAYVVLVQYIHQE